MQLSVGLLAEFQSAYKDAYGTEITAEIAEAELLALAELVVVIQKPIKIISKEMNNGKDEEISKAQFSKS